MIKFHCKNCGQKLNVEDKHSGKRVKCPKCGSVGVAPDKLTTIKFQCKSCGQSISVPQIHAGKKGKCPKCQNIVVVPKAEDLSAVDSQTGYVKPHPPAPAGIVRFQCPMCDDNMQAPESSRGKLLECPNCGSFAEVPKKEDISKEYATKPQEQKLAAGPTSQFSAVTSVTAASRPLGIKIVVVSTYTGALLLLIPVIRISIYMLFSTGEVKEWALLLSVIMLVPCILVCAIVFVILKVCHSLWEGANWARITLTVISMAFLALMALTITRMLWIPGFVLLIYMYKFIWITLVFITIIAVVMLNSASVKKYCGPR